MTFPIELPRHSNQQIFQNILLLKLILFFLMIASIYANLHDSTSTHDTVTKIAKGEVSRFTKEECMTISISCTDGLWAPDFLYSIWNGTNHRIYDTILHGHQSSTCYDPTQCYKMELYFETVSDPP